MTSRREAQIVERVRQLVVEVSAEIDVEILDVDVRGQGPRRVVKVVADTLDTDPGSGLDVDTVAELSRRLGAALDEADLVPGSHTLEVTSPGADRPLTRPRDFARNVGRRVHVVCSPEIGGSEDAGRQLEGTLVAVADDRITLEGDDDGHTELDMSQIDHGRVVLPW